MVISEIALNFREGEIKVFTTDIIMSLEHLIWKF